MDVKIGASVICMDPLNLQRDIERAITAGIDYLHFDVMDGVRVPRYGLYPEILSSIEKDFTIRFMPIDVHLMVADPLVHIDYFTLAKSISFHLNGNEFGVAHIIETIASYGVNPGLVINLGTPAGVVDQLQKLNQHFNLNRVMLMGCHPGRLQSVNKVDHLCYTASCIRTCTPDSVIQVDGGVRWDTIPKLVNAGVNSLVCGSATLYSTSDLEGNLKRVRDLCTK